MTKTRWGVLVVALFTSITISEGFTASLAGQTSTSIALAETVKPARQKKPTASRHALKQDEARRRLMRELYQIAIAPMPLRAGRAGLLFDRLRAEDDARRIAELERLRPRRTPRVGPPVHIGNVGDLISGRVGM